MSEVGNLTSEALTEEELVAEDAFWDDFRRQRRIEARIGNSARRDSRTAQSEHILNELTGVTGEILPERSAEESREFWTNFFEEARELAEEEKRAAAANSGVVAA